MNDLVLDQLIEADATLASQAATLEAQLAAIQEKREGLQTVIVMFQSPSEEQPPGGVETNGTAAAVDTNGLSDLSEPVEFDWANEDDHEDEDDVEVEAVSEPEPVSTQSVKSPRKAKRSTRAATKKTKTKKRDGRAASWQRYIKDSFQKEPLPEVISGVLRNQPNHVFLIAEVMNAVFEEDMPKSSFLKARNRVSNILSGGARDGSWYRGRNGRYSMSENVVKAS